MSGHSKWSQIKRKKALTDKKRGQIFSKLSRAITLAARKGADPKTNLELARIENVPNENIERAVKKISEKNSNQLEELAIEALASSNIALKIRAITDNRNRTLAEIKKILVDFGVKMVQPGSLQWLFGQPPITLQDPAAQEQIEKLFEALDDQDDVEDVVSNLE